jgi:hypothetical protein
MMRKPWWFRHLSLFVAVPGVFLVGFFVYLDDASLAALTAFSVGTQLNEWMRDLRENWERENA